MLLVAGLDGYPRGWIAVVLRDGRFEHALVGPTLGDVVGRLDAAAVIGVDIPIGLPAEGRRPCDLLARAVVGPRRASVFFTAPRPVWEAPDYATARQVAAGLGGASVSAQTYALRAKVLEADALARNDDRLVEVHPEVTFATMAGGYLVHSKSTWAGIATRRRLLRDEGIELPDELGPAGAAGVDDVLDAAGVAWSAGRIARGEACSLPPDAQPGPDGLVAAIRA
jgi:predicted RNase H-like nuclease